MSKKHIYKAVFNDNVEITRATTRIYSHAWRVSSHDAVFNEYGFSGSLRLATNAANQSACHRFNRPGKPEIEIVNCQVQS
jgi:hypothetical protein